MTITTSIATTIATAAAALALAAAGAVAGPAAPAHAQPAQCTNSDLTASYHSRGAGAGHRYGVIALTNTSRTTCFVQGYGGLSYVGHGDGTQIGAAADRDAARAPRIVLRPGQRAASEVSESVAGVYPRRTCRPVRVDGFRVYVPDSTVSQYVVHRTTGCAARRVHLLAHQPYHRA